MVYIIVQLKYGNKGIRMALFGDNYFRIMVTPDCIFDHKVSAALCSEIWNCI